MLGKVNSYLPLRQRDVLTREGKMRMRYVVSGVALSVLLLTGTSVATINLASLAAQIPANARMAQLASIEPASGLSQAASLTVMDGDRDPVAAERLAAAQKRLHRYKSLNDTDTVAHASQEYAALAEAPAVDSSFPREEEIKIGKGDTLGGVLKRAGLSGADSHQVIQAMKGYYDPRDIKPGQVLNLRFEPSASDGGHQFASLQMQLDPLRSLSLQRSGPEGFSSSISEKEVRKKIEARRTEIENSLYGSALKSGLPRAVVAEAIRIYSYDVDFQRDIQRGDSIEVLYEQYQTEDGHQVKTGNVLMARINVGGQIKTAYRYEGKDGHVDYFTQDGKSLRKTIMMTPIDGARISSGFGMRKHPVLGYSKMHKGMDFAAPTGTPIFAAGDGTVEKASRFSSYGNYVKIRHAGGMKTAYAHLSRYGKGITPGTRVKQGQIIGYVGTTGRSTGPHLHFEVLVNGVQVNPRSIKAQQGEPLKGTELASFKESIRKLDTQYTGLTKGLEMASASQAAVN